MLSPFLEIHTHMKAGICLPKPVFDLQTKQQYNWRIYVATLGRIVKVTIINKFF